MFEEKLAYQLDERMRDMNEMVDNCNNRVSSNFTQFLQVWFRYSICQHLPATQLFHLLMCVFAKCSHAGNHLYTRSIYLVTNIYMCHCHDSTRHKYDYDQMWLACVYYV